MENEKRGCLIDQLVVLLIFVLIIYTIMVADSKLSSVACILLVVLSGVYVFILAIDIISQFSGEDLPTIPMFIFSFLGSLFFLIAGILLLVIYSAPWTILTIASLSLFAFVLFLIDVSLTLAFWKRTCTLCQQSYYVKSAEVLFQKDFCEPTCPETVKYDLMTSVSSVRVHSEDEGKVPDHSYRKVSYGRRRQYVDCPTSARSVAFVNVANVQTECYRTCNIQSQTQREVKEVPIQTVSRCELCNRKIQLYQSPSGTGQQTTTQQPCTPCPALVQLFRGTPCCPGCVTGIIQVSQQSQQQQTQRQDPSKEKEVTKDQTVDANMLTSENAQVRQVASTGDNSKANTRKCNEAQDAKLAGVSGTITKLTLASYCLTPKRIHTSCQTAASETVQRTISKEADKPEESKKRVSVVKKEKEKEKKKRSDSAIAAQGKEQKEQTKAKATNSATKRSSTVKPSLKRPSESTASKQEKQKEASPEKLEGKEVSAEKAEEKEEEEEVPQSEAKKSSIVETSTEKLDAAEVPTMDAENVEAVHLTESTQSVGKSLESLSKTLAKIEPKKLIPPPRQVAEIIDRLQEIKGGKPENPLKHITTEAVDPVPSTKEIDLSTVGIPEATGTLTTPRTDAHSEDKEEKGTKNSEGQKVEETGNVIDRQGDDTNHAITTHDSISISKIRLHRSESDLSITSQEQSTLSVVKNKTAPEDEHSKREMKKKDLGKAEQGQETESTVKPRMGTQTAAGEGPNRSRRTFFRKTNKVEPTEMTHTDTGVRTLHPSEIVTPGSKAETEKPLEKRTDLCDERAIANTCPACKRIQMPMSVSFQYYNVHRDKRGRLLCDHCATSNTTKILYKKDIQDMRRLKCASCGNSLRTKSTYIARHKPDNCPQCGQVQLRTQSTISA